MISAKTLTRRAAIAAGFGGAGALIWNANSLTLSPHFGHLFGAVEEWTMLSQRALLSPGELARESLSIAVYEKQAQDCEE